MTGFIILKCFPVSVFESLAKPNWVKQTSFEKAKI